ncbi:hypothetical protein AB0C07_23925 [Actinoplanes missouriensis]|uniref:hypothetical protein n=1 Tax=Actinoplanes missouriensis TaxID=1866 RepID=UPI0033C6C85D
MARVRADRFLIPDALAETLRHSPPVQMIQRQPSEDVELSGGTVPAGANAPPTRRQRAANALLDAMDDIEPAEPPVSRGLFTRAPSSLRLRFTPAG